MEKVYLQSFQVEQSDKNAILTELADIDPKDYEGMELFRGTALSSSVNSHSLYFSADAMRQVRDALDNGLGIFTDHDTSATNRVGKTLKANYRNERVMTTFGVIPGLEAANSDDLIKIMQLAGNEMSIAFYPAQEDGIECDICRLTMEPYFFGYIWMCNNYHMLGERYEDGDGVRTVLGEVMNIDRISELSVVGNGSDPNTDVVKQIMEDADFNVSLSVMNTMAELNNLNISSLSHQLSTHQKRFDNKNDLRKIFDLGRNPEMAEPTNPQDMSKEDLLQQLADMRTQLDEANEKLEQAESNANSEELQALAVKLTQTETELQEEKDKNKDYEELKAAMDKELVHWRLDAKNNKKKQMAYDDDDPRYVSYCAWADGCNDVERLRVDAMTSLSAYAVTCLEKPTMTIDTETSEPRIGSGYTN